MADMNELTLLLRSRHPIVVVESDDEARLLAHLEESCRELFVPLFTWRVTEGIARLGAAGPVYETGEPLKAFAHLAASGAKGVYVFLDLAPYLTDARLVRAVRDVAQAAETTGITLVLAGPSIDLPLELRGLAARWELALPDRAELAELVLETFKSLNQGHSYRYDLSREDLDRFVTQLGGLSAPEARRIVSRCVLDDGALDGKDFAVAIASKRERVEATGVLEFEDTSKAVPDLGGLSNLKGWLERAHAGFGERARDLGLTPPRGILLVGVQGCGKSLACRSVARQWNLPLVRLDASRLFDKYVGESEKNLRQAFHTAEAIAPVVLWIDEIEKAFAMGSGGGDADAGLSKRLFGAFLTWLQEKEPGVFVAATANDLSAVPPELLRKGRFDEVFFVDLPNLEERKTILALHLARRKQDPATFDLDELALATEGWSGAELEQAIVTALYAMIAENAASLTADRLLAEIARTVPLSRSRREEISALRAYASERFVPAGSSPA